MERRTILCIPQNILSVIASYLPFVDVLNFRHVCTTFYTATNCRLILQRFHLRPRLFSKRFSNFISTLNGGKFIHLSLCNLTVEKIKMLVPHIPNVNNLEIKMQWLPLFHKCSSLKVLLLYDKEINYFTNKDHLTVQSFFNTLSNSTQLESLYITGCKQVYKSMVLITMLKAAKSINSLTLESLIINNSGDGSMNQSAYELKTFFASCTSIRHWAFHNIHIKNKRKLYLPRNALTFKAVDTVMSPLTTEHSMLETLVINGVIPYLAKIWKCNNFVNLKHLELHHTFFYHGKLPYCRNLKTIKLFYCHLPLSFLMNLSPVVKTNLKELWIEARKEFNNENVLRLIQEFPCLSKLCFISMHNISVTFLSDISHPTLEFIVLKDCHEFKNTNSVRDVKALEKNLRFKVVLDQQISCATFY